MKLYSTNQHHAAAETFGGADAVLQQTDEAFRVGNAQDALIRYGSQFPGLVPFPEIQRRVGLNCGRFHFRSARELAAIMIKTSKWLKSIV